MKQFIFVLFVLVSSLGIFFLDNAIKDIDFRNDIPLYQARGQLDAAKIRVCIQKKARKSHVVNLEECLP